MDKARNPSNDGKYDLFIIDLFLSVVVNEILIIDLNNIIV